jgi:GDPmannose 4,6-dehydratase
VGLDYREFVKLDEDLLRPAEVDHLLGDATRARQELDWQPRVTFEELVAMMVDADLERHRVAPHARQAEVRAATDR